MSLPSLYEWFFQQIKQNLLMMTLIITSTFKQQKYFNFYLNKLLYCLRLVVCFFYALMWLSLLGTNTLLTAEAVPHMRLTQRNNHANISELLDNLLRGYDNSIRPGFGGEYEVKEISKEILRKFNLL